MRTGSTALLSCLNALSMETSTSGHAFADFATHRLSSKPPSLPTHGQNRRTTSRLRAAFSFRSRRRRLVRLALPPAAIDHPHVPQLVADEQQRQAAHLHQCGPAWRMT